MKNIEIFSADKRGGADYGWLKTNYSFSFANYYNPDNINFGKLRVLNDDIVLPESGFGTHPHEDMEIITIPLHGAITHKDSMGFEETLKKGEVQVMSAGTGLYHSEYNNSDTEELHFLQIWIFSNKRPVDPRYEQKKIDLIENDFTALVSPKDDIAPLWIYQDAWIHRSVFDKNGTINYKLKSKENGLFVFTIDGEVVVEGKQLSMRDAAGVTGCENINFTYKKGTDLLIIEVPMS
jgi:redox-sensitive bicupin YhaK (pirin superfamily)